MRKPNKEKMTEYMSKGRKLDYGDPTILNYFALLCAIFKTNKKNNYHSLFYDKEESKKRMKELDEIYARGDIPPIAKYFKSESEKYSSERPKMNFRVINKNNHEHMVFKAKTNVYEYITRRNSETISEGVVHKELKKIEELQQIEIGDFIVQVLEI